MVTTLSVRISRRPCAVSVLRWPGSTCRQGSPASWRRSRGWLPFTVSTQCAPRRWQVATCSRWVCSASAVITTRPGRCRSGVSSKRREAVISLVLPSTSIWPSTMRVCWSITASRCRARARRTVGVRDPRRVLPSTASTRRRPAGAAPRTAAARTAPITASNRSASTRRKHPADRRLRRTPTIGTQSDSHLVGQVSDPLGDRDERPRPGRDRAHRGREHDDQPVATPRGLRGSTTPASASAQVSGPARPDRVARPRPPGRRRQRSTMMQARARLSSDDQGWRENRQDHHQSRARTLTSARVSPQLSAHSPRLCRPPGEYPRTPPRRCASWRTDGLASGVATPERGAWIATRVELSRRRPVRCRRRGRGRQRRPRFRQGDEPVVLPDRFPEAGCGGRIAGTQQQVRGGFGSSNIGMCPHSERVTQRVWSGSWSRRRATLGSSTRSREPNATVTGTVWGSRTRL